MNFHQHVRTRSEVSETWKGLHHPIYYPGGGGAPGNLGGGVPPGSPHPDPISDQKMSVSARFHTWPLKNDAIITYTNKSSNILKDFLRFISSSRISLSFLFLLINTFVHSRSFLENHIQFQTKTAQKTLPFRAAHTHMACIRGNSPPPPGVNIFL